MGNTVRIRNGMSNATEGDILGNASDVIKDLGVVDLAGGHLLVTEDSPKGMTVQVAGGVVYVPNSNYDELDSDTPKFYPVVGSAEVLTIDSNVSGSTRYDIVCMKVDKTIMPDPDADNIATKVVVKGTPGAGVPATPANHYKLAEIEVVNGETEIENSMITDTREQVTVDERFVSFAGLELTESTKTDINGIVGGDGTNLIEKTLGDSLKDTDDILDVVPTAISEITTAWIPAGETWNYVGASSFSISGDKTSKYQKEDKLKLTNNGAVKYFKINTITYSAPNTIITVLGMESETLHNSAITLPYYSKSLNPQGFSNIRDYCSVAKSAAHQTIPGNDTVTALVFDWELYDSNSMHDNSTNNSRITIKRGGYYAINASIRWESVSSGGNHRTLSIYVNGNQLASDVLQPSAGSSFPTQNITMFLYLAAGDYVEAKVSQNSGSNLDVSKWTPVTFLQVFQMF